MGCVDSDIAITISKSLGDTGGFYIDSNGNLHFSGRGSGHSDGDGRIDGDGYGIGDEPLYPGSDFNLDGRGNGDPGMNCTFNGEGLG